MIPVKALYGGMNCISMDYPAERHPVSKREPMRQPLIKPAADERARAVAIAESAARTAIAQAAFFATIGAVLLVLMITGRLF